MQERMSFVAYGFSTKYTMKNIIVRFVYVLSLGMSLASVVSCANIDKSETADSGNLKETSKRYPLGQMVSIDGLIGYKFIGPQGEYIFLTLGGKGENSYYRNTSVINSRTGSWLEDGNGNLIRVIPPIYLMCFIVMVCVVVSYFREKRKKK